MRCAVLVSPESCGRTITFGLITRCCKHGVVLEVFVCEYKNVKQVHKVDGSVLYGYFFLTRSLPLGYEMRF